MKYDGILFRGRGRNIYVIYKKIIYLIYFNFIINHDEYAFLKKISMYIHK